jgi:hydroxylamine reductase
LIAGNQKQEGIIMSMFCYQCEQTAKCTGCTTFGVCGKDPDTAVLQDLLVDVCKQIAVAAKGKKNREADLYVMEGLFTTVTNVNFDANDIVGVIRRGGEVLKALGAKSPINFAADVSELSKQGEAVGIESRKKTLGDDITGLQELILYGLKGTAAYADHAYVLGKEDPAVFAFFHEALATLKNGPATVDVLLPLALKVGEVNLTVMGLLDAANTETYGHPVPTPVNVKAVQTDRRQGHQHLHPRRNASVPWLPAAQEVQTPRRQLRRGVAGSARRVRSLPRRDSDDNQLHPEAEG